MPADNVDRDDPDIIAMAKAMNSPIRSLGEFYIGLSLARRIARATRG